MTSSSDLHEMFRSKLGSSQIASAFAIQQLEGQLWSHCPQRILEVGAGIGTLSAVVSDYINILNAEATVVEDNPWCQEQWAVNLYWWSYRPVLFDKVPAYEFYDFVILDGEQMPPDGWACLAPRATVFVEGNRRPQRARLRQYLRHVGRPFCETPYRPRDRSKGIWLIQCEPTWWERLSFATNRLWQWVLDFPARFQGRPIGKRLVTLLLAVMFLPGCALAPLVIEKISMVAVGIWGVRQHQDRQDEVAAIKERVDQMEYAKAMEEIPLP